MPTRHVFVETNWVVSIVAPAISWNPAARDLLERGRRGELALHVPAISLSEARKVVRERNPSTGLNNIREFVRARVMSGDLDEAASDAVFSLLSRFQQHVAREKDAAPDTIAALLEEPALDVFPLDEAVLVRSTQLSVETSLGLNSFDNAILAAVLVRGAALHGAGHEVCFCTQDSDLQPWDKRGKRKDELSGLLDDAGIWVYGDFLLKEPPRPPSWPAV